MGTEVRGLDIIPTANLCHRNECVIPSRTVHWYVTYGSYEETAADWQFKFQSVALGKTLYLSEFVFPNLWGGQGSCRVEGERHIWSYELLSVSP